VRKPHFFKNEKNKRQNSFFFVLYDLCNIYTAQVMKKTQVQTLFASVEPVFFSGAETAFFIER